MPSLRERIEQKLFGKKEPNSENIFDNINFILAYEFHWDYDKIMNTPIPFILSLIENYKKLKEEERKTLRR